jgi:hypothetical protein
VLVLELAAHDGACYSAEYTMAAHFVATKVAGCSTTECTHETAVALSLCIWVGRTVARLCVLAVGVRALALRICICRVCALLGELVLRLCTWVLVRRRLRILVVLSAASQLYPKRRHCAVTTHPCCCWS